MRFLIPAAAALALALAAAGASRAQTAAPGLAADRFKPIAYSDIEKWSSSGCSFAVFRGKDNLALFDTQDAKKTAAFKIDGKMVFVPAGAPLAKGSYWSGAVAGAEVRMIKGKRDPKFKNDGGSQGGAGSLEWNGPGGNGSIPIRWEEGC